MAICPLLRKECIRGECAWWYDAEDEEDSECTVVLISDQIAGYSEGLEEFQGDFTAIEDKLDSISEASWDTYNEMRD